MQNKPSWFCRYHDMDLSALICPLKSFSFRRVERRDRRRSKALDANFATTPVSFLNFTENLRFMRFDPMAKTIGNEIWICSKWVITIPGLRDWDFVPTLGIGHHGMLRCGTDWWTWSRLDSWCHTMPEPRSSRDIHATVQSTTSMQNAENQTIILSYNPINNC